LDRASRLLQFPFNKDALKTSELGKVLVAISKNPGEPAHTREAAQAIISLWSRSIFRLSTDYARAAAARMNSGAPMPRQVEEVDPTQRVLDGLTQKGTLCASPPRFYLALLGLTSCAETSSRARRASVATPASRCQPVRRALFAFVGCITDFRCLA
jgi:hypothetical protein